MQFLNPPFPFFLVLFAMVNSSVVFGRIYAENDRGSSNEPRTASTITVDQNGRGNFRSIQQAIDSIPSRNTKWITVLISPGTYTLLFLRTSHYVYLKGLQGLKKTVITFNDHESTDTSATFTSSPDNVVVKGITFKNSYNRMVYDPSSTNRDIIKQAMSARIYGDKSMFVKCGFLGFQDTLWDVSGRHYFNNCYIEGAVDFIFGSGQSFYENSLINVTIGKTPEKSLGYITAQGRKSAEDSSGFVFYKGSIVGTGKVLLGRAYGPYSRVVFIGTDFGPVVAPEGWDAWDYKGQETKFTYSESGCRGPGSDTSGRVPWAAKLSASPITNKYSRSSFIDQDNWISRMPH